MSIEELVKSWVHTGGELAARSGASPASRDPKNRKYRAWGKAGAVLRWNSEPQWSTVIPHPWVISTYGATVLG